MKPLIVPFFIAHQGCPHQCIFCNQEKITGAMGAIPAPSEIISKIAAFRYSGRGRSMEVAFFGGTFTALPKSIQERLLRPLAPLLASGELASVRVSTRPDAVDSGTVEFLKQMGVRTVELGIQSMDDTVLERAGRGHSARDSEEACSILAEAGFRVGAQLMPGLPGDTLKTATATLRRTLLLKPDFLRIYPTLVIAGTELDRMYRRGEYAPLPLYDAVALCKILLQEAIRAAVPVVRIGLQASEELQEGVAIVAGPWHAAFRQLVEGELFYDLMVILTDCLPARLPVIFYCAPARVSEVTGHRRANLLRLRQERGIAVAGIKMDPGLSAQELRMEAQHITRSGTMLNLNYAGEGVTYDC